MLQHHPNRPLANLRRKLIRRLARHRSTPSGVGASGQPGAVHPQDAGDIVAHTQALERFITGDAARTFLATTGQRGTKAHNPVAPQQFDA